MVLAAQADGFEWEARLVQRARAGDVRAFERLYREHIGAVYGLCLRLTRDETTAHDCAQEAFFNAWRGLERFENRSRFGTWLHRIAVNVVLTRRRTALAHPAPLQQTDDQRPAPTTPQEQWTLDTPMEIKDIEAAVRTLPDGARDVLVLCAIYGYSHGEAARMLGIAEGTCKAQLHRARSLLRIRLHSKSVP